MRPSVSSLVALVDAMQGGTVQTLVVLGGNPVFDAPADLDFASAMAKVPHSIVLAHSVDEMAKRLPNCRLEVFPYVGHSMNLEVPLLFARVFADFFRAA